MDHSSLADSVLIQKNQSQINADPKTTTVYFQEKPDEKYTLILMQESCSLYIVMLHIWLVSMSPPSSDLFPTTHKNYTNLTKM